MSMPLRISLQKIKENITAYFFTDRYGFQPLVTLRIGLGCILLIQCINLMPDVMMLIGNFGLIRQDLAGVEVSSFISSAKITQFLTSTFQLNELAGMHWLLGVYIIAIMLMILGCFTRLSVSIVWLLHLAFVNSGHFFSYGVDYFLTMLLFYCMIFPVGKEYSIDSLFLKRKKINYTPYVRILQIHLCIVYIVGGVMKIIGNNWWNGNAIWKAIKRPNLYDYHLPFLSNMNWAFIFGGIATFTIELLYVFCIHHKATRKTWLALTCILHISIALLLQLPYFAATMVLFNIAAFYYPVKPKENNIYNLTQPVLCKQTA